MIQSDIYLKKKVKKPQQQLNSLLQTFYYRAHDMAIFNCPAGAVASPLVRQKLREHIIMKNQPSHDRITPNHCSTPPGYRWEGHLWFFTTQNWLWELQTQHILCKIVHTCACSKQIGMMDSVMLLCLDYIEKNLIQMFTKWKHIYLYTESWLKQCIYYCFWLPRLPVPDISSKPQPTPCDQRKDLALRRTGETPVCPYNRG